MATRRYAVIQLRRIQTDRRAMLEQRLRSTREERDRRYREGPRRNVDVDQDLDDSTEEIPRIHHPRRNGDRA